MTQQDELVPAPGPVLDDEAGLREALSAIVCTDRGGGAGEDGEPCKACSGTKVIITEIQHSCTNCSGKGYCAAGAGGNRFVCTFCRGTGQVTDTVQRSCETCQGTGVRSSPSCYSRRGDTVDKIKFEENRLVFDNLALGATCLVNFAGLVLFTAGVALLMGHHLALCAITLTVGVLCMVAAFGRRTLVACGRMKEEDRQEEEAGPDAAEADRPISCDQLILIATLITLPNVFLLYFFSDIGVGVEVVSAVAPPRMNLIGDLLVVLGVLIAGCLLVLDWAGWSLQRRMWSATIPIGLLSAGAVLKGRRHAWAPMLALLWLVPAGLAVLRASSCRLVRRASFYKAAGILTSAAAFVLLTLWLLWIAVGGHGWSSEVRARLRAEGSDLYWYLLDGELALDGARYCGESADLSSFSGEERSSVKTACATAASALLLVYACPFIACVCNGVVSLVCFLKLVVEDAPDTVKAQKQVLHRLVLVLIAFLTGVLACTSIASTSARLGATLMALLDVTFMVLVVWVMMEADVKQMAEQAQKSEFTRLLLDAWHADWTQAVLVVAFNVLIPIGLLLGLLNTKVRKLRGKTDTGMQALAENALLHMQKWKKVSMLLKLCLLVELFFVLQVALPKMVYVFLAWVNTQLADYGFGSGVALAMAMAYGLLLLPLVPAAPVYVFVGMAFAEHGRQTPAVGFAGGACLGVLMGFVLKQTASMSLYVVGLRLGRLPQRVQALCPDQVLTSAVEKILEEPGFTTGKVALLLATPDWMAGVACGILRLGLTQLVVGTCITVVVVGPCALAGAFLSQTTPGEDSIWNLVARASVGLAALLRVVGAVVAAGKTLSVAQRHVAELRPEQPESDVEADPRRKQRADAYQAVVSWDTLHRGWKAVLLAAAGLHVLCSFAFVLAHEAVFSDFDLKTKISDPTPEGLDGHASNVVLAFGWVPIWSFAVATVAHLSFVLRMRRLTTLRLGGRRSPPASQGASTSPGFAVGGPASAPPGAPDCGPASAPGSAPGSVPSSPAAAALAPVSPAQPSFRQLFDQVVNPSPHSNSPKQQPPSGSPRSPRRGSPRVASASPGMSSLSPRVSSPKLADAAADTSPPTSPRLAAPQPQSAKRGAIEELVQGLGAAVGDHPRASNVSAASGIPVMTL